MNTKRVLVLGIVLLASHIAFFVLGEIHNRRVMLNALAAEDNRASAAVDLGLYLEYRDLARDIVAKQYDRALCAAQLGASGRYDDLKACLAAQGCRGAVEQRVQQRAPEILGAAPLNFEYISAKDGIRSCGGPAMTSANPAS